MSFDLKHLPRTFADLVIANPRVGGSIPPLGTTFTNKNNGLPERNAR
jgi:hypothetical protein